MRVVSMFVAVAATAFLYGCSTAPRHAEPTALTLQYQLGQPRVDVEHLRKIVLVQPPQTYLMRKVPISLQQQPTIAIVCSDRTAKDCESIEIISEITAALNAKAKRIEGVWLLTYGNDLTIKNGQTTTHVQHSVPARPAQQERVPFSIALGEPRTLDGPFDLKLNLSVLP